jgi:hypothetical protein
VKRQTKRVKKLWPIRPKVIAKRLPVLELTNFA